MIKKHWKLILGILIGLSLILLAVITFTRSVPPYTSPADHQVNPGGTLDANKAQALQAILDNAVNQLKVPGLQAYVSTAEGLTWSGTSGTSDLGRNHPMQPDDILRIGSVTKSFTAVITLKLVETGQLSLQDALAQWFPEIPGAQSITIRNLLNHTSGIEEIIPKGMMKSIIPNTVWQQDDLMKLIASSPLKFSPGSQWEYSNSNYILLGLIAEKITGKSMLQLYHQEIIDPLSLKHTSFIPFEPAPAALITGYDRDLSHFPGMLDITPANTSWATLAYSSGAMVSTAEDLGTFVNHLMAGDLLSMPMMKEMTSFVDSVNPGFPAQNGYGLGLMRLTVGEHELVGHVGQFMGFSTIAMFSPEEKYTIVVIRNLSNPELVEVISYLQEAILK